MFHVVELEDSEHTDAICDNPVQEETNDELAEYSVTEVNAEPGAECSVDTDAVGGWIKDWLYEAVDIFSQLDEIGNKLSSERSKLDLMITDIQHYIEFNGFNACQGYKLAKKLQYILKERRKIKDCLYIVNTLNQLRIDSNTVDQMVSNVSKLDSRKYFPRIIEDVYGDITADKR